MIDCEIKNGWLQFLQFVERNCPRTEFENWLAPIQCLSEDDAEVHLEVPNIFVQEYLINNYSKILRDFLPVRSNGEVALSFSVTPPKRAVTVPKPVAAAPVVESGRAVLGLNPLYRFEHFIEGPANQFAKAAALGVAEKPGKTYNPLFLYGGVGLGKTHLLHSIGHYAKEKHKKLKVQVITTEALINDIVDSLKSKSMDHTKRFYRGLDILLVDDIQFLQNRLNFEEEICNTFEALINQNKQIVITSDKPPAQLQLSERMTARMGWGLVVRMEVPDFETRAAILTHKLETRGIAMPSDVALFIAEHIHHNIRQLEGAINRLSAYARLHSIEWSIEMVERILGELLQPSSQKRISIESLIQSVATAFAVRVSELLGESRCKDVVRARQVAMYLAKEMIGDSLVKIAAAFGGKTHSSLFYAWKKIAAQIAEDEILRRQIQMVKRNLE